MSQSQDAALAVLSGINRYGAGDLQGAAEALREALSLCPEHKKAQLYLGWVRRCLRQRGEQERAAQEDPVPSRGTQRKVAPGNGAREAETARPPAREAPAVGQGVATEGAALRRGATLPGVPLATVVIEPPAGPAGALPVGSLPTGHRAEPSLLLDLGGASQSPAPVGVTPAQVPAVTDPWISKSPLPAAEPEEMELDLGGLDDDQSSDMEALISAAADWSESVKSTASTELTLESVGSGGVGSQASEPAESIGSLPLMDMEEPASSSERSGLSLLFADSVLSPGNAAERALGQPLRVHGVDEALDQDFMPMQRPQGSELSMIFSSIPLVPHDEEEVAVPKPVVPKAAPLAAAKVGSSAVPAAKPAVAAPVVAARAPQGAAADGGDLSEIFSKLPLVKPAGGGDLSEIFSKLPLVQPGEGTELSRVLSKSPLVEASSKGPQTSAPKAAPAPATSNRPVSGAAMPPPILGGRPVSGSAVPPPLAAGRPVTAGGAPPASGGRPMSGAVPSPQRPAPAPVLQPLSSLNDEAELSEIFSKTPLVKPGVAAPAALSVKAPPASAALPTAVPVKIPSTPSAPNKGSSGPSAAPARTPPAPAAAPPKPAPPAPIKVAAEAGGPSPALATLAYVPSGSELSMLFSDVPLVEHLLNGAVPPPLGKGSGLSMAEVLDEIDLQAKDQPRRAARAPEPSAELPLSMLSSEGSDPTRPEVQLSPLMRTGGAAAGPASPQLSGFTPAVDDLDVEFIDDDDHRSASSSLREEDLFADIDEPAEGGRPMPLVTRPPRTGETPGFVVDFAEELADGGAPELDRVLEAAQDAQDAGDSEGVFSQAEEGFGLLERGLPIEDERPYHESLAQLYESLLMPLYRVPLAGRFPRDLEPHMAFLLSLLDGSMTIEEVLTVSGMDRLRSARAMVLLMRRGLIRLT